MSELIQDDALILYVRPYQTADKYVSCYTREHGKIRFIAYGARYSNSTKGRILQPFTEVHIEVQAGKRIDRLQSAELVELPQTFNMEQMAYAAVATELAEITTETEEAQEALYELLKQTLKLLRERHPRIVVLAFALKLLQMVGLAPQMEACVQCGQVISQEAEAWFNALQGGIICEDCHGIHPDGTEHCGANTRELWRSLLFLNMNQPESFKIKGETLMELEHLLYKFIVFHTDKELQSLKFLAQIRK